MDNELAIVLLTAALLSAAVLGLWYQRSQAGATDRQAGANERSAEAGERALALEEERRTQERADEQERKAPRFVPLTGLEAGPGPFYLSSDRTTFEAHLWNVGPTAAEMSSAELDVGGGRIKGLFAPGSPAAVSGGRQSKLHADPNAHVTVRFDIDRPDLLIQVATPLGLHVTYEAFDGEYHGELFLPLHRNNAAVAGQLLWRGGEGRVTRL